MVRNLLDGRATGRPVPGDRVWSRLDAVALGPVRLERGRDGRLRIESGTDGPLRDPLLVLAQAVRSLDDIPAGATVSGYPARDHRSVLRQTAALSRLTPLVTPLERLVGPHANSD